MCVLPDGAVKVPRGMKIIAVSLYAFTLKAVQKLMEKQLSDNDWKHLTPSPNQIQAAAQTFCSIPYPLLQERARKIDAAGGRADFNPTRCFQLSYIKVLLSKVLGIAPDSHSVQFADSIEGQDLDWPLGLYLVEAKLTHVDRQPDGVFFERTWVLLVGVLLVGIGSLGCWQYRVRRGVLYSALPNTDEQELREKNVSV